MGTYDVAQVCRNDHVANDSYQRSPQHNKPFCPRCGAPTLTACESCYAPIQGDYLADGVIGGPTYTPPAYCLNCGQPYPWMSEALQAARELAGELGLSPDDREALLGTLDDLVRDTPRTQLATVRFKKLAAKTGQEGAALLRNVLYGIVTEAVRRGIWGP